MTGIKNNDDNTKRRDISSGTITFSATGTGMSRLIKNFVEEGDISRAMKIITTGNDHVPIEVVYAILRGEMSLEGDTREDGIYIVSKPNPIILHEGLLWGLLCDMPFCRRETRKTLAELLDTGEKIKLYIEVFKRRFIEDKVEEYLLGHYKKMKTSHGVILQDGRIIHCEYMGHSALYEILYFLGLSDSSNWARCEKTLHFTGWELGGPLWGMIKGRGTIAPVSNEMLSAIWDGEFTEHMGNPRSDVFEYHTNRMLNKYGRKGANLRFVREFYPDVLVPEMYDGYAKDCCIRTSPLKSMPGMLRSRFNVQWTDADEMQVEFDDMTNTYPDIFKGNELRLLYHEYISGSNGVASIVNGEVSIKVGGHGGVVNNSNVVDLEGDDALYLAELLTRMSRDLYGDIQLEFVINKKGVYIVQLRQDRFTVPKHYEPDGTELVVGRPFTKLTYNGNHRIECDPSDLLVISGEVNLIDIIDKKVLIMTNANRDAHIVLLAYSLGKIVIWDTGDFDLNILSGKLLVDGEKGFIKKL